MRKAHPLLARIESEVEEDEYSSDSDGELSEFSM